MSKQLAYFGQRLTHSVLGLRTRIAVALLPRALTTIRGTGKMKTGENVPSRYRLTILMGSPTQFDGPLFARLKQNQQLDLEVYYSAPSEESAAYIDPEIGIHPMWSEMATQGHECIHRTIGLSGSLRFMHRIVARRPHLIVISGYVPLLHFLVALYAHLWGVPVGLRSDTTLDHSRSRGRPLRNRFKTLVFPAMLKLYSTVHPVGTLATEYLLHHGVPKNRVFPFPYAVNNDWFCSQSAEHRVRRGDLRREMNIAEDAFVVLGILKFHEREDPLTLVRGFAELQSQQSAPCHLALVGDGPLREEIEAEVRRTGIRGVSLLGYVPYSDLPKYYAIADVFVHPAVGESWGVSVNESMACGLPVVVADRVGSHVDLVREGETGWVFRTKDPTSLAQRLATMAADRELCRTMGENARDVVAEWGYEATERFIVSAIRYVSP